MINYERIRKNNKRGSRGSKYCKKTKDEGINSELSQNILVGIFRGLGLILAVLIATLITGVLVGIIPSRYLVITIICMLIALLLLSVLIFRPSKFEKTLKIIKDVYVNSIK